MKSKMVAREQPKRDLERAIEAACSAAELVDEVSEAELRFHFQYIAEKIHSADQFARRDQIEPERKWKAKRWAEIQACMLRLHKLTQATPSIAYEEMEEVDPELRFVYLEIVEHLKRLADGLDLSRKRSAKRGRPTNEDLEDAVGHLAAVYSHFFGRIPSARSEDPESGPFFRFCRAVVEAVGKHNLVSSLVAMIEKVCEKGYRPRHIGPGV